jgi:hypothetical protein
MPKFKKDHEMKKIRIQQMMDLIQEYLLPEKAQLGYIRMEY